MTVDELVRRLVIAMLAPALGERVLFVRLQHREPLDLPKITGEAGSGRYAPVSGRQPTHELRQWQFSLRISFETKLSVSNPIVNLLSKRYYFVQTGHHASTQNGRASAAGGTARASRRL